jgi:two-component system nitrate/nitrite sensor histidine kinase NarX
MVSVPLQYRGQTLGIYNLFMDPPGIDNNPEMENLLKTIGHHLGMLIGKAKLDMEARRKIIMQERSMLANELHDTLAQTLASVRFQVRVLDESLQSNATPKVIRELEQVENSLEEAYSDLRQLIAHCREPDVDKGLLPSIQKLVSRFMTQTGINTYLQQEWALSNLPAHYEMQILRIVQEALSNIRKHSSANFVRILLRCDKDGNYHILIENDGEGFDLPDNIDGHTGEHIGLTIMEERARHLNGSLKIESEPGEGTRIEVNFHYDVEEQMKNELLSTEMGQH